VPRALIITVGGSDAPVVEAVRKHKPDYIYFVCSGGEPNIASSPTIDGEGKVVLVRKEIKCPKCKNIIVSEERRENILKQSGYRRDYKKIEIYDPDNFNEVYQKISDTIDKAKQNGYEIIADFTAGTKTMSSVLAMLSILDFDIKPSLTIGRRRDIIKTEGLSISQIINVNPARVKFFLERVSDLISRYLYYPASLFLERLLEIGLEDTLRKKINKLWRLCKAFYSWEKFEYQEAFEVLKDYSQEYPEHFNYLLKLLKKDRNTGYEPVFDLISNAQRQAYNGFYDNAVARLYRALELFAQIRLKKEYQIDTSHLENSLDKLKDKEKWEAKKNEDGEIKIGLKDAYELLLELEDRIGQIYKEKKNKFIENIKLRNNSKLAHGDYPVNEETWRSFFDFCREFIETNLKTIKIKFEHIDLPKNFKRNLDTV